MIVAIDGPAGAGKSSTARQVAGRLGYLYLDTGAMYRAIALAFLRRGAAWDDAVSAEELERIRLSVRVVSGAQRVFLGDEDVSDAIRGPEVSAASSRVSAIASVRALLVREQRRLADARTAEGSGIVMEGRDIGTVVFPDAGLKIFLTADPAVRARRRAEEYAAKGVSVDEAELLADMTERDSRDTGRSVAPLRRADDAVLVDTSELTLEEQVEFIVRLARERGA